MRTVDDASCPLAIDPPPSLTVAASTYRKTVAIGFLGTNLDAGRSATRWDRWRPTVALAQHEALTIDRLEVLFEPSFADLMNQIAEDISHVAPDLDVCPVEISLGDPWDFEQVYSVLHDFARNYDFRDDEDYLVHITTGSHVAQICMFLLFLPVGSDREAKSDFQLIGGTNRSLLTRVREGQFRDDLLSRINLWTFELPALAERREDIEPNLAFELERVSARLGRHVTFNAEARKRFLAFSDGAPWPGNFRDFAAAITRMATLARGGRIDAATVGEEVERLQSSWAGSSTQSAGLVETVMGAEAASIDPFDRVQLEEVFRTCRAQGTLSEAGRALFVHSRQRRKSTNDADRLRKFLARWGVDFASVKEALEC